MSQNKLYIFDAIDQILKYLSPLKKHPVYKAVCPSSIIQNSFPIKRCFAQEINSMKRNMNCRLW